MKPLVVFLIMCVGLSFLLGCVGGTDAIEIVSVNPSSGLQDGVEYTFTVTVSYVLKNYTTGEITVNFNNDADNSSLFIRHGDAVQITQGSREYTFNVSAIAKDWGTEWPFSVTVLLFGAVPQEGALDSDIAEMSFQ